MVYTRYYIYSTCVQLHKHINFYPLFMQFDKLDHLGYSGIGFDFLEDDVHYVGTPKASTVLSDPQLIEYLHSIIIASRS